MNRNSYILKYIIMIIIFFIIIKLIIKSKCSNLNLINIIMVGIIIHYLFKLFKFGNIKENFDMLKSNHIFFEKCDGEDKMDLINSEEQLEKEIELKRREEEIKNKEKYINKFFEESIKNEENNKKSDSYIKNKELVKYKKKEENKESEEDNEKNNNIQKNNSVWGENYDNDLNYNELPEDMMEPLGKIDTSYSFMPPWKWWPPRAKPPMCSREAKCSPCPITAIGTPTDVKEWDISRFVTPGLGINIPYIEKLNRQYNKKLECKWRK